MTPGGAISASVAENLLASIGRVGGNPDEIRAKIGMQRSTTQSGAASLSLAEFTSILECGASEFCDSTFGFELAKVFPHEGLGPVAQLLMATLTIGDGVSCFARNLPALQTSTKLSLSVHGDLARIDYKIDDPTVRRRAQDANFSLGILHSILARLLGQRFRIVSVELEQLVRGAATAYQKYFSCPIRFGQATNAICFPANFLELPNPFADICIKKRLERELANQFARSDFIASVRAWMTAGFALSAPVDIECAAADFGMSPRSFQRKLSTMEVSYLDLRNEVRSQIARCMLADTSMPITTVALHLGYSEASAFSRYFRLQTGLSPAEFRARSWDAPADPA